MENYAQTDLDGNHAGRTLVSVTPGVRFNLGKSDRVKIGKDNWIMLGTDIPISDYKPWDAIYRFTYIRTSRRSFLVKISRSCGRSELEDAALTHGWGAR